MEWLVGVVIVGVVAWRFYYLIFNQMGVNKRYPNSTVAKHRILTFGKQLGGEEVDTSFVKCHTGRDAWKVLKNWMFSFGVTAIVLAFIALISVPKLWYDVALVAGIAVFFYTAFWKYCFRRNRPRAVCCITRKGGEIVGYVENIDFLALGYKFGGQEYETIWDPKIPGPQAVDQEMSWDISVRNKSTNDPITIPNVDLSIYFKILPLDPSLKYDKQPIYLALIYYESWDKLLEAINTSIDGFTEMYFRNFSWEDLQKHLQTTEGESQFSKEMKKVLNATFKRAGIGFVGIVVEGFENPKPIQAMAEADFEGRAAFKKADGLAKATVRESEGLMVYHENVAAGHNKGLELFKETIGDGTKAAEVYINLGRQEADVRMSRSAGHLYMVPSQIDKLEIQTPVEEPPRSEKSDKEDKEETKKGKGGK